MLKKIYMAIPAGKGEKMEMRNEDIYSWYKKVDREKIIGGKESRITERMGGFTRELKGQ